MDDERMVHFESVIMHLQHELEQMHHALLGQADELASLRRFVDKLQGQVDQLEQDPEVRDLQAEKPPHY